MGSIAPPPRTGLRWVSRAFLLAIFVLSCAAAYWIGSTSQRIREIEEGLVIADGHLDFGEVWETSNFSWTLPIENRTRESVKIDQFASSCYCLSVDPSTITIPAGETVPVRLILDLSSSRQAQGDPVSTPLGPALRDFFVQLAPVLDDGQLHRVSWTIRGRVRSAITLSPPSLEFRDDLVRGHPFTPKKVVATAHLPMLDLQARCDPSFASVSVTKTQDTTDRYELEVTPQQKLSLGSFSFGVKIAPVTRDGRQLPEIDLPVRGVVLADIRFTPSSIPFGAVPLGTASKETIVLSSRSRKPFRVEAIKASSADVSVESVETSLEGGQAFRVTWKAARLGHQSTLIHFSVRSELTPETPLELFLPVSYHGVQNRDTQPAAQGVLDQ